MTAEEQPPVAHVPGTVGGVMGRDVVCVRADVSIESITAILDQRNIGAVPVVDGDSHLLGIVSKTDLIHALSQGGLREQLDSLDEQAPPRTLHTAGDVMSPIALTLREGDLVSAAAEQMRRRRVHHAPVLSVDGRVVGIVATLDLLAALVGAPREMED